jgi:hypothetical protein
MQCKSCGELATGKCWFCGGFFCAQHGGIEWERRPRCADCFEARRPRSVIAAVVATGLGILSLLIIPTRNAEQTGAVVKLAFAALVLTALMVWNARRRNPYRDHLPE